MPVVKIDRSHPMRANELTSIAQVLRAFLSFGSPRVMIAAIAVLGFARLGLGGLGWFDLFLALLVVLLAGPVEWVIHRTLLHAPDDSFRMRRLKTGTGHRQHHLDPHDVGSVSYTHLTLPTILLV